MSGEQPNTGPVDVQQMARDMLDKSTVETSVPEVESEEVDSTSEQEPSEDKLIVGGHPAWEEVLTAVPEEFHEALIPKLKGWDGGVTRRFQEIHSQYEPLKAFEPLVQQGFDPDTLSQAIGLYQALNDSPDKVYEALGEAYGFGEQESESDDYDDEGETSIPRELQEQLDRQERALEAMAEELSRRNEQEQNLQQTQELDNYLNSLRSEYGDFDEDYVVTKLANGMDGEVAVRQYQEIVGPPRTPSAAPKVMGSSGVGSGGIPTDSPEISKLSSQDTQSLVESILQATNET